MYKQWINKSAPKILVVRNDGLGDLILTLPMLTALKEQAPHSEISVLINQRWQGLIPFLPQLKDCLVDPGVLLKRDRKAATGNASLRSKRVQEHNRLLRSIREKRFDLALLPYAEADSAALVQRAGIPHRVGPLRRHFFWRFNHFVTASARKRNLPEYMLKLQYLSVIGLKAHYVRPELALPFNPNTRRAVGDQCRSKPRVLLHPLKKSGTALSWPLSYFVLLARGLLAAGFEVGVLGETLDGVALNSAFKGLSVRYETGLSLMELVEQLAKADLFIGNSSGPLHLAALLDTPHIGLYPQNAVDAPQRWRTLPSREEWLLEQERAHATQTELGDSAQSTHSRQAGTDSPSAVGVAATLRTPPHTYLLKPQAPLRCVLCAKQRCAYFNCMEQIAPETVLRQARELLSY